MHLEKYLTKNTDGYTWKCLECRKRIPLRSNNAFFSKFPKIILPEHLDIALRYCATGVSAKKAHEMMKWNKISIHSVSNIYHELRVLISYHIRNSEKVFKSGSRVAIDESHFITEKNGKQVWVFGIVNIDDESHGLINVIEEKSQKVLITIIRRWVITSKNRKSLIIPDGWAAYNNLEAYNYNHSVELHNRGFFASVSEFSQSCGKSLECDKA